jgi:hypothetical protein
VSLKINVTDKDPMYLQIPIQVLDNQKRRGKKSRKKSTIVKKILFRVTKARGEA